MYTASPTPLQDIGCTNREVQCKCMPGWTGARCEISTGISLPGGILGWCQPPVAWWTTTDLDKRNDLDDKWHRSLSFCSGHGHCAARTAEDDLTRLRYTFCQCDEGYYGETCQYKVYSNDTYGDFYNYAFTEAEADQCNSGAIPAIVREFFNVEFPRANCSQHGFGVKLPLLPEGLLDDSNAFRVQTASVCYCEPGFNGEECLGGQPVPDSEGWIHGACSALLLIVVAVIYRDRKRMETSFNVEVITPADFTVFVNHLPTVKLGNIQEVYDHFAQFGEVHFVAPAMADDKLVQLQKEKNRILAGIQILNEKEAYARKLDAWKRAIAAAGNDAEKVAKIKAQKPEPMRSSLLGELAEANESTEGSLSDGAPAPALTAIEYLRATFPLNMIAGSRAINLKYLLYLNSQIKRELGSPEANSFARCFVTFKTADARDNCLKMYSERRDGMFGKLPDYDPCIVYQGKHWIKVSPAPDPAEVQWQSLGVGPRVRGLLMTVSFLILVAIVAGFFQLVLVVNESQATGIIGLLISLAIVVLNVIVGQFWFSMAGFEQHYYKGASMRSVFLKILITQIFITLLAGTIGVYGYPLDAKNGYNQDWYRDAGGFVFRMVLVESVAPPLTDIIAAHWRIPKWFFSKSPSLGERAMWATPYESVLAMRCASLMRTVIMCAAFNAGLPILNFAVAFGLAIRYESDKWCYKHVFAVVKSGPELARALELSLMFATAVQVVMGWVTLRAGWETNLISEAIFYIGVIGVMWAITGYFSYRWARGRDCWGGSGPVIPCIGWLCCFSEKYLSPFWAMHEAFMVLIFGVDFFDRVPGRRKGAEAGGDPYIIFTKTHALRRVPYYLYERGQLFPGLTSDEEHTPYVLASQYKASVEKARRLSSVGSGTNLQLQVSPLILKEKKEKMLTIAQAKAATLGLGGIAGAGKSDSTVVSITNPMLGLNRK